MIRTNVYLTKEQLEKLNELARELDKPVARIVREAIDTYFEKRKK